MEGAGLVPWVGGPPDASLWFYGREAFQSQTNTDKILYKSRHWYVIGAAEQQLHKIAHVTDKYFLWWLVIFHPVVGPSVIT